MGRDDLETVDRKLCSLCFPYKRGHGLLEREVEIKVFFLIFFGFFFNGRKIIACQYVLGNEKCTSGEEKLMV